MKRIALLIGALLLAAPTVTLAVDCSALSGPALSEHYVQRVLDRADAGMAYATTANANTDFFDYYLPTWARSIGGTFAQLIDSRVSLTERSADLANTTACLRHDELLLECKMEQVQNALKAEVERGSFLAIMRLQSLLLFLQERMVQLRTGALDSRYDDPMWERQWLFDEVEPEELEQPLCPFHSDYVPAEPGGYGCDVSVLQSLISRNGDGAMPFAESEMQSLRSVEESIERFREIVPLLQQAASDSGSPSEALPPVSDREHRVTIGCEEVTGRCSEDDSRSCTNDTTCRQFNSGNCVFTRSAPVPKQSLRGSFSFSRDHLQILTDFVDKRIQDGLSRTFPAEWAETESLPEGENRDARDNDDLLLSGARSTIRLLFRSASGVQGREEAATFATATDAPLEIAASLSDLRASVGELSRLASQPTGIRAFVVNMASFLRRTCAFRPCQRILEQVLRIALETACFPYTDGQFLSDSEGNPRWKQCAIASCTRVTDENGEEVELPESCDEILLP